MGHEEGTGFQETAMREGNSRQWEAKSFCCESTTLKLGSIPGQQPVLSS